MAVLRGWWPLLGAWGLGLGGMGPSYHAELGLQFNLQALQHPPELSHLTAATLHQFAVRGHFFVQFLGLREERRAV